MAKPSQIALFINDVFKESIGKKAPTIKDTSDLIAFAGTLNLSEDAELKDAIWTSIVDKVRKTYIYARKKKKSNRNIRRDIGDWGIWYEEIRVQIGESVENLSFQKTNVSPYEVEDTAEVTARYFKAWATWEHDAVVYDRMLISSLRSFAQFGSLVSAMFIELDNVVETEMQNNENLTIATAIAGVLKAGKPSQCRNLLAEYNTITNESLTVANCRTNSGFLTYIAQELQNTAGYMEEYTTLYNTEGTRDHTPKDKLVVEMLKSVESSIGYYLKKDTFHENIIKLPMYRTVNYWQSGGESMRFEDTSKINIKNDTYSKIKFETPVEGLEIEQGGIIAVMRDVETCASVVERLVTKSLYNPRQERTIFYKKVEAGYGVNLSHNMVVFYVAET